MTHAGAFPWQRVSRRTLLPGHSLLYRGSLMELDVFGGTRYAVLTPIVLLQKTLK